MFKMVTVTCYLFFYTYWTRLKFWVLIWLYLFALDNVFNCHFIHFILQDLHHLSKWGEGATPLHHQEVMAEEVEALPQGGAIAAEEEMMLLLVF